MLKKIPMFIGQTKVEALAPIIVSASRSTDIPAFYAKWFMDRVRAGYVVWVNPFNRMPSYVSFANTRVFVFWTKNPKPLLPYLPELDKRGFKYYFQFTLNDYCQEGFEPNVPSVERRIEIFHELVDHVGPDRVVWRYDPIMMLPNLTVNDVLHRVAEISKKLRGLTHKLVFSFVDVNAYRKVQNNLIRSGVFNKENVLTAEPTLEQRQELAAGMAKLRDYWAGKDWNYTLATCAEGIDLSRYGIEHNRCIDGELMYRLFPDDVQLRQYLDGYRILSTASQTDLFAPAGGENNAEPFFNYKKFKDKGQRNECGCVESKDIGMYNTCSHNCIYCYANTSAEMVRRNRELFERLGAGESIIPFQSK